MNERTMLAAVQDQYGAVARSGLSNDSAAVRSVAKAFGYSEEELASLPPQANMGLSCGNPVAIAGLRDGEVVLDLGCGGGLDVLLAAKRVGASGKAIGIDMTPDMIERATAGAAQVGATNVEFHLAQINELPVADASVDCVISNCVINLVPDKAQAFREIMRVLKPGGRLVISDIALRQPLPSEVAEDIQAHVGCIAGAVLITEYERLLREAGFSAVFVQDTGADLNAYAQASSGGCCSSAGCSTAEPAPHEPSVLHDGLSQVLSKFDANEYAASVRVHALKVATDDSTEKAERGPSMKSIQVFDKPMCCPTGVCGPEVDPVLPRFAADLQWLRSQGHQVERFNLAREPDAFLKNHAINQLLVSRGANCLPVIVVDGHVVSQQIYPSREELANWASTDSKPLSVLRTTSTACCGGQKCC